MAWTNNLIVGDALSKAWLDETREAISTHDGIGTTASIGVTVTFTSAFATVDDYAVQFFWQEDPGLSSGELYPVKSVGSCIIYNTGNAYGKKFAYRIVPVKSL